MAPAPWKHAVIGTTVALLLGGASAVQAQPDKPDYPWSVEFGLGWDNGISGQINSSGVGELNNQVVVITNNSFEDVYGNGLHIRFGGGYMFRNDTEARLTFTFQSLDADFIVPMGDIGVSNLYGEYTGYQAWGIDLGLRRYGDIRPRIRGYGEVTIGLAIIDETDVTLVAPGANLAGVASDFYDQTSSFTLGANVGLLVQAGERIGLFGQIGLRYVGGMSDVDNLSATGLDDINDKSARWTLPIIAGIRYRF